MEDINQLKQILKEEIDIYKDIPLSDSDMLDLVKGKANLVTYSEIHKYRSIDELLAPYGACIILYETKPHFGHWVCLTLHDGLIEYFNSYGSLNNGGLPDDELKHIPKAFAKESHQDKKYLTKLLVECDYELSYNEFQFQELDNHVKDCGRWVVLRIIMKSLSLEDFSKLFFNMYSDDLVTYLTAKASQLQEV